MTSLSETVLPGAMFAFGLPGGYEWLILLVLGLLIFGRRLPEVGRSIGRSIVEFKRGIKGIEEDIDEESTKPPRRFDSSEPARRMDSPEPSPRRDHSEADSESKPPASGA